MKTRYLTLIAVCALAASCTNENLEIPSVDEKCGVFVSLEQPESTILTKGLNWTDNKLTFAWEEGELLSIFNTKGNAYTNFKAQTSGENVEFKAEGFNLVDGDSYVTALPPSVINYRESGPELSALAVSLADQTQNGADNTAHLKNLIYAYTEATEVQNNTLNLTLHNQVAWIVLQYTNETGAALTGIKSVTMSIQNDLFVTEGTMDATAAITEAGTTASAITATNQANSLTLTFKEPVSLAENETCRAYFTICPVDLTGQQVSFTLTTEDGTVDLGTYNGAEMYRNRVGRYITKETPTLATINGVEYNTLEDAFNAVEEGQTITLVADVVGEQGFIFTKNVNATLDLNGHTLKVTEDTQANHRALRIDAGTLTIQNGTVDARNVNESGEPEAFNPVKGEPYTQGMYGTIRTQGGNAILKNLTLYNNHCWGMSVKHASGSVSMEDCTIISEVGGGVEVAGGEMTISNCTFKQTGKSTQFPYVSCAIAVSGGAIANITNTNVSAEADTPLYIFNSGGTLNINGGKYEGRSGKVIQIDAQATNTVESVANITNGEFIGALGKTDTGKESIVISGGTFTVDPTEYLADGYTATKSAGIWTVEELTEYVTVSGISGMEGVKYATMAKAYDAGKAILEAASDNLQESQQGYEVYTDGGNITWTIKGQHELDETTRPFFLTFGRRANHYGTDKHIELISLNGQDKDSDGLNIISGITLPYEWWRDGQFNKASINNLTLSSAAKQISVAPWNGQCNGVELSVNNCRINAAWYCNTNNPMNVSFTNNIFDGTETNQNYALHIQGHKNKVATLTFTGNTVSGYNRGINIDQKTCQAEVKNNTITSGTGYSAIQISQCANINIEGNTIYNTGDVITIHETWANDAVVGNIILRNNTIKEVEGIKGYLIYDDVTAAGKTYGEGSAQVTLTYEGNTVPESTIFDKGIKGTSIYNVSSYLLNQIFPPEGAWNGITKTEVTPVAKTINGVETRVYEITQASDLAWIAEQINNETLVDAYIELSGDINLNNKVWTPISDFSRKEGKGFSGTFDGGNHTITNLTATASEDNYGAALLGVINGGTVKNVKIDGGHVTAVDFAAAVVGTMLGESTITNCEAKNVTIESQDVAAGIVARAYGTSNIVRNCTNSTDVTGAKAGGIIGISSNGGTTIVDRCENNGTIYGATAGVGGIVGYAGPATNTITSCTNNGTVGRTTDKYAGGIVGYQAATDETNGLKLKECYNLGGISGIEAGGIYGIPGGNQPVYITACNNYGTVTATNRAGGIAARAGAGRIYACINGGKVYSAMENKGIAGGVVGELGEAEIDNCNGGSKEIAAQYPGRLVGHISNKPYKPEDVKTLIIIYDNNGDNYDGYKTIGAMGLYTNWANVNIQHGTLHGKPAIDGQASGYVKIHSDAKWDAYTDETGVWYCRPNSNNTWVKERELE